MRIKANKIAAKSGESRDEAQNFVSLFVSFYKVIAVFPSIRKPTTISGQDSTCCTHGFHLQRMYDSELNNTPIEYIR